MKQQCQVATNVLKLKLVCIWRKGSVVCCPSDSNFANNNVLLLRLTFVLFWGDLLYKQAVGDLSP